MSTAANIVRLAREYLETTAPAWSDDPDQLTDEQLLAIAGPGFEGFYHWSMTDTLPITVAGLESIAAAIERRHHLESRKEHSSIELSTPTHSRVDEKMTYTKLQQQFLRYHWAKWSVDYGWSPRRFAEVTKQPAEALAELLNIPLEDFAPPLPPPSPTTEAAQATPAPPPPPAPEPLPAPGDETVTLEPGVEFLKRKPAPPPMPTVLLSKGRHVIDGVPVDVDGDSVTDHQLWPLEPGMHNIDGKVVHVYPVAAFRGYSV